MEAIAQVEELGEANALDVAVGRPTTPLPISQLINLSAYWFGLTAIWAGLDSGILPKRVEEIVGPLEAGKALATVVSYAVVMPVLVQPTIGAISDYTATRWGKRKPYIAIGAVLDVLFLVALANGNSIAALTLFYTLLQFSSNFAQGAFQGYMPDLVPARQVGMASGLMGVMIVAGQVGGALIGTVGLIVFRDAPAHEQMFLPTIGLGIAEFVTALVVLIRVNEGPPALPRNGRSWISIALSPWGRETLHERSFLWLVGSRLLFLAGTGAVIRFALFYLERAFGLDDAAAGFYYNLALLAVVVPTLLVVIPAARLSDRVGRKPLIYAACASGFGGLAITALAPAIPIAIFGLVFVGLGAGSFLAVDWALMTDIIPKATAGRFMGISNVGTAVAGPLAAIFGGLAMDSVARSDLPASPRAAYLVGATFFILAALLLRKVDPTPHD